MKKITAATIGVLLIAGSIVMAQPSAADQKWLEAVQKMVEEGQTKISTPSKERVDLFKDWAAKKGVSVVVTQVDASYKLEIVKTVVKN
jgi:hypothetical protein